MGIVRQVAGAVAAALAMSGSALAQDLNAAPTAATLSLAEGFDPDPRVVELEAGGSLNATSLSAACSGFIPAAPHARIDYSGEDSPLILSVSSPADTSLFVVAPNGAWYCDDESGVEGANPALHFGRPATGAYLIWVGGPANGAEAQLQVSASSSQ